MLSQPNSHYVKTSTVTTTGAVITNNPTTIANKTTTIDYFKSIKLKLPGNGEYSVELGQNT